MVSLFGHTWSWLGPFDFAQGSAVTTAPGELAGFFNHLAELMLLPCVEMGNHAWPSDVAARQ